MRIIGLDFGSKTVGVALSDALGLTAQPVETITRKEDNKLRRTYARIEEIIKENDVNKIVIGLPLNMDDSEGERALACRDFAAALERRTGLEVVMWDERLTTVEANEILMESGVKRENRKAVIDQLAAVFILQGYLDYGDTKDYKL
ncbi:MAG: Holliday junction resolvase RuvX [Lachnospira sp.]